ncbi:hypothetical protein L6164_036872 [Bauhinia variegata]|uniref:Uncharacterized protein n=1 Tax=Bauhinia variegata TaxID=167791 RepID=A0ACB9KIF7_BAUVA|nr:hypothetical protein L6164_036872 [Bauhinia variegata]
MPLFRSPHLIADINKVQVRGDTWEIPPRGLNIVWGNDPRYWSIPIDGPAGLIQVCWLEVSGSIQVTRGRKYQIRFEVQLKPDSFGWNGSSVLIMAKVGKQGNYQYEEASLNQTGKLTIPMKPSGLEIDVPIDAADPTLYFGLYEVWSGKWKGGLEIHKATVRQAF